MPFMGRADEVSLGNVISYLALVIGINVSTEGNCWCAYIWNLELACIDEGKLISIFIISDILIDFLYFSLCFLHTNNELNNDTNWFDYLVSFSERNLFLYFTLLYPVYKISSSLSKLDNFWFQNTMNKNIYSTKKSPQVSSSTRSSSWKKLFGGFLLAVCSNAGGVYLILWTYSHLKEAS